MKNSPTEEALFAELDALADPAPAAPAAAPAAPASPPVKTRADGTPRLQIADAEPEIDEEKAKALAADLDIPLEEARAKLIAKAKKVVAEAAAKAKAEADAKAAVPPCAACGQSITPENGSKLQTGLWVHVGCPRNAAAPTHPQTVTPPDAPPSNPALASEQPKPPAAEKPKRKPKAADADPNEVPDGRPASVTQQVAAIPPPLTLTYSITFKTPAELAEYAARMVRETSK